MWSELIVHVQPALLWLCLFTKNIYLFVVYTEYVPNKPSCKYYNYISLKVFLRSQDLPPRFVNPPVRLSSQVAGWYISRWYMSGWYISRWYISSQVPGWWWWALLFDNFDPPARLFRWMAMLSLCLSQNVRMNDQVFVNFGFSLACENQLGF